jgi:hypothetical protein
MICIPPQTRLFQPGLLAFPPAEWFIGNLEINRFYRCAIVSQ